MLVLTRKAGDGIVIGDEIRVTILENKEGRIRLGIEAPQDKKIYREEVYQRICEENKEALQWDVSDYKVLTETIVGRGIKK
jgi:carbon storage regulator